MEVFKLQENSLEEAVSLAIKFLEEGKVLVVPTDTVYGLVCDDMNETAVGRIFEIKQRPKEKTLPIFVSDIEMAKKYAEIFSEQERFLERVWPGAVSVVLRATARTHAEIGADSRGKLSRFVVQYGTIAMRIPKNEFLLEVLKVFECPLAQTSANISDEQAARSFDEAIQCFSERNEKPDFVFGGGEIRGSSSSVIDLSDDQPKLLREGAVSFEFLSKLLEDSGLPSLVIR